jgi:hypothetical protein
MGWCLNGAYFYREVIVLRCSKNLITTIIKELYIHTLFLRSFPRNTGYQISPSLPS